MVNHLLTLKVPVWKKLQLYGLYVYYVVHICDFGMLRVKFRNPYSVRNVDKALYNPWQEQKNKIMIMSLCSIGAPVSSTFVTSGNFDISSESWIKNM